MTPRSRIQRVIASVVFCTVLAGVLAFASAVLKPARKGDAGGSTWSSYLAQDPDSLDVIFFGTSHAFSGVDPCSMWRSHGITSYVLAGPAQDMSVTYYYMREAVKTQQPDVIALEMTAISYRTEAHDTAFQQTNVGYMPWSVNKIGAGLLATPKGERTGALVDLWTYHSRWTELSGEDWDVLGKNKGFEYLKGYLPRLKGREVTATPYVPAQKARIEAETAVERNLPSVLKIAGFCERNDIELVLFLTPTGPPRGYTYPMRLAADEVVARYPDVHVLDLSEPGAIPGLSYKTDFFDGGHLRDAGARKVAPVLAEYLARTYGLPDHRGDSAYAAWNEDARRRDAYVARRLQAK